MFTRSRPRAGDGDSAITLAPTRKTDASFAVIMTVTILPVWMGMMDASITNVGFNIIAGALNVSIDQITAISAIYMLAMLTTTPLSGWVAANFGRKRAFIATIGIFTLASLGCGLSHSLETLLVARFVQGLGAGLMASLASAAMIDAFPQAKHALVMRTYGIGSTVALLMGPVIGGWMLANYPWQFAFLINLPLGVLAMLLGVSYLPEQRASGVRSAFNWTSLGLMAVGFGAFLYVVEYGTKRGWFASSDIVAATLVALGTLGVFTWLQLTKLTPLVELRTLRVPSFAVGTALAAISGIGITASAFVTPLYYQQVLGYDTTTTGVAMLFGAIALMAAIQLAALPAIKRIPAVPMILIALTVMAASMLWMTALGQNVDFGQSVSPRVLLGFGSGLMFTPLNLLIIRDLQPAQIDAGFGLVGTIRQLGLSLSFSLFGTVLANEHGKATAEYLARIRANTLDTQAALAPLQDALIAHGLSAHDASAGAVTLFLRMAERAATTITYTDTFFLLALFFIVCIPAVALLLRVPSKRLHHS